MTKDDCDMFVIKGLHTYELTFVDGGRDCKLKKSRKRLRLDYYSPSVWTKQRANIK